LSEVQTEAAALLERAERALVAFGRRQTVPGRPHPRWKELRVKAPVLYGLVRLSSKLLSKLMVTGQQLEERYHIIIRE
jgi:hypothetical protein